MGFDVMDAARERPDEIGLVAGGEGISFAELARRAAGVSSRLADLPPGARVALGGAPTTGVVAALYAIWSRRLAAVPLHPRLAPRERRELVDRTAPARVLDDEELADPRGRSAEESHAIRSGPSAPDLDDVLACLASSGTTGQPKIAELTRRSIAASAAASAANLGWSKGDRWLCCMPLAHVGGLSIITRCLAARAAVVLLPKFDEAEVLESIARDGVTILSVVPTMLGRLVRADAGDRLRRLRAVLVGGAPARKELLLECYDRSIPALTTYGLTEASSQVTCQSPARPLSRARAESSGPPLPGVEVSILGEDGVPMATGQEGRIHVRGPTLMRGYAGELPLDPGAWFDTGDVGRMVGGGELQVLDRRVDLIVSGGENVYPSEVEERLRAVDGVADALVFGVADERWGQLVAAAIVARGSSLDRRALSCVLDRDLAPYKRPRLVCVVDRLPVTDSGKLDRAGAAGRLRSRLGPLPDATSD